MRPELNTLNKPFAPVRTPMRVPVRAHTLYGQLRFAAHAMALTIAMTATVHAGWFSTPEWPSLKQEIRKDYPQVKQMSISELQALQKAGKTPVLLDVRAKAEFDVSHLQNARLATHMKMALAALDSTPKDAPILLYCSVGMRSSDLAKQLMQRGYSNVANLEGSIFEWANLGLPVYRGDAVEKTVHPFNGRWGKLLNENLRAPL